jgi:integrase/recombinase XerD
MSLPLDHPHIKHWTVASTMRYVRASETFIEDACRQAISAALGELTEGQ